MQDDDFDSSTVIPDDELIGDASETDLGDLGGAGDVDADGGEEPSHRGSAAPRGRSSSGSRKPAAKARAPKKAAKKKSARKSAKKRSAGKKRAKKKSARKPARKAGRRKK